MTGNSVICGRNQEGFFKANCFSLRNVVFEFQTELLQLQQKR